MRFTKAISVSGSLLSSFVFENEDARQKWLTNDFPALKAEHGNDLQARQFDLDGLQVGDDCYVHGDGDERYTIKKLIQYSPHRYGFVLDHGFSEEVAKCYR